MADDRLFISVHVCSSFKTRLHIVLIVVPLFKNYFGNLCVVSFLSPPLFVC